jgi:signal transduction histidine kinase
METPKSLDPRAAQHQEIVFSLVMTGAALLGRESPLIAYPSILWVFAAMLGFNLAYQVLARLTVSRALSTLSVGVNVALVSLALHYSGGFESPFWPLFLVPIFTACLRLEPFHVAFALGSAAGYLGLFYIEGLWNGATWGAFELLIKIGVLLVSSLVTAQLAHKERSQREELTAGRKRLERLAADMERDTLRSFVPGVAHNLNNPLMVILGTVELMKRETAADSLHQEDLDRIQRAARACAKLTQDLVRRCRDEAKEVA